MCSRFLAKKRSDIGQISLIFPHFKIFLTPVKIMKTNIFLSVNPSMN